MVEVIVFRRTRILRHDDVGDSRITGPLPVISWVKILDLFCCAGGASVGYHRAGFEVVGVDIDPQPHYPFEFHQADALTFPIDDFDAVHASPPCQAYTIAQRLRGNEHPDLVAPVRHRLRGSGLPWVIENVVGAPLNNPIMLCGEAFDLGVYRHRLFESNVSLVGKPCCHDRPISKMGRPVHGYEMMHVVGNFSGVAEARSRMGIDWMTRNELRESIPPAYTQWIGAQILAALR